jgi:predicted nucleic acid-binding protein
MTELKNHSCFVDSNIWLYAFSTDKKEETKRIIGALGYRASHPTIYVFV